MKRTSFIILFLALVCLPNLAPAQQQLDFLEDLSEHQNIKQMLPDYMKARAHAMLAKRREDVAKLRTPEDFARRKAHVRKTMAEAVGGFPERTPLKARVVGVLERDDYKIERIIFESQPSFYVTANLYLPKTGTGPYPAVLYPLGHERGGKSNPAWQRNLIGFARKGFVALTWDPIGQGERYQIYDEDLKRRKTGGSTTEHTIQGVQALLVGDNVARYTIWDGIRALDYLLSRPEVDSTRIACTGNSGGGTHTAYLSALEDRIHVAMPSCYITSWDQLLETIGPQDAEQNLPPWIGAGLDHADFIYAFAPRPYIMLSAIRDFFSITGARNTYAEAKDVYRRLDAEVKMSMFEADDGHGYHRPRRLAGYNWLSRWFKGTEDHRPEPEGPIASFEELKVTETGQVSTSLGGENVFTLNRKRAAGLDKKLPPLSSRGQATAYRTEMQNRLRKVAAIETASGPPTVRPYGVIQRDGYHIEKFVYESEPGIIVPSLLFVPEGSGRKPAILYLHGEGKSTDAEVGGEIETFTRAGYVVLAIDPRGVGETNALERRSPGWSSYFGQWDSAMTGLLMGKSLIGMRVLDIQQGLSLLAARPEVDASHISAIGKGTGGLPLLYTAVVDDRIERLALEGSLVSYSAVVNQRIHQDVFEHIAWGALKSYDLPDLVAALTPRPVWITNATDPLGQQLPMADVEQGYEAASKGYSRTGAADGLHIIRRKADTDPKTVYPDWF